jgi:hypothetical protein
LLVPTALLAAPKPDLWPRWQTNNPASTVQVDHAAWGQFLARYLVADHPSGINRVRYAAVSGSDRQALAAYLDALQSVRVAPLNRAEQKAYWINLYNALTVKVILDHYPVSSIRDIDISPGLFSSGPWDAKLLVIEGEKLSLNDIEHRILRPIWRDQRVHFAVNCASLGCPNLQPQPFTAGNAEALLEQAARQYVNHPRGASFNKDGKLILSAIFDWYGRDFSETEAGLPEHLARYAEPALATRLKNYQGTVYFEYAWALNQP